MTVWTELEGKEPVSRLISSETFWIRTVNFTPGVFTQILGRLYVQIVGPFPTRFEGYPGSLRPLIDVLARGNPYEFVPGSDPVYGDTPPPNDRAMYVGFSGGKDSTAVALRARREGYDPTLIFVRGINRAYGSEYAAARQVAKAINMPMVTLNVLQSRIAMPFLENPVKNQLILALMLDHGLTHGVRHYVHGNYANDKTEGMDWKIDFSDSIELYEACASFFSAHVPGYVLHSHFTENGTHSFLALARENERLFDLISSCMTPARYKVAIRRTNEQRFGPLRPGRCGSCYKCVDEYLHLAGLGLDKPDPARVGHAIVTMRKQLRQFFGLKVSPDITDEGLLDELYEGLVPSEKIRAALTDFKTGGGRTD